MGRFLQKHASNDVWFDVGDKRAQEKTSQALREGAPELRTKLQNNEQKTTTASSTTSSTLESSESQSTTTNGGAGTSSQQSLTVAAVERPSLFSSPPPIVIAECVGSSTFQNETTVSTTTPTVPHPTTTPVEVLAPFPPVPVRRHTSKEQMPPPAAVMVLQKPPATEAAATSVGPPAYTHNPDRPPPLEEQFQAPAVSIESHDQTNTTVYTHSSLTARDRAPHFQSEYESVGQQQQRSYYNDPNQHHLQQHHQQQEKPHARNFYFPDESEIMTPPPPPSALDPNGDCSFGSMGLMTDAEQSRLENVVTFDFQRMKGVDTATSYPENIGLPSTSEFHPSNHNSIRQEMHQKHPQYPPTYPHHYASNQNNYSGGTNHRLHAPSHQQNYMPDDGLVVPQPVDGGLEPIGLSFGSMMSIGTSAAAGLKLEGAGLSIGSTMSYTVAGPSHAGSTPAMYPFTSSSLPTQAANETIYTEQSHAYHQQHNNAMAAPPDSGLHDIGTSFGSLTLADGDRERIIADAERDMARALAAASDSGVMAPTFLQQQKSKGNLLDCSDTESEDEESSVGISAQKSVEWEKLQAVMAERIQTLNTSHATAAIPPQSYMNNTSGNHVLRPGTTFNIPAAALDREFSQMSAISVGEDFEPEQFPYPNLISQPIYEACRDSGATWRQGTQHPEQIRMYSDPKEEDTWGEGGQNIEHTYLNRGNSLASEAFSEPPECDNTSEC